MLKGSFSLKALLRVWLLVVLREEEVVQKDLRSSGGEGGMKTPLSLISVYTVSLGWLLGWVVGGRDLPLSLYSAGSRSLMSIGFVSEPLVYLSTSLVASRRFSSCLRRDCA